MSPIQVKCLMQQILSGLDHCHSKGILHRDMKGSNLLIDSNGVLKIADFGLATFYDPESRQPLTSRVATLWYRPPELLLGATRYSAAVDMWSTGCILGELLTRKPTMPGRTEVQETATLLASRKGNIVIWLTHSCSYVHLICVQQFHARWSKFTRFSSSVDHLLTSTGRNWKCPQQGCSSPCASISGALPRISKIYLHQL